VYDQGRCIGLNRESHNNEIYANTVSDCKVGIIAYKDANNNKINNNTIMDSTIALAVNSSAYDNAFYSNIIINSKEFEIMDSKEDSDTSSSGSNSFENNKLINSKAFFKRRRIICYHKILP
jgi:parallel beta-helix repeat protein